MLLISSGNRFTSKLISAEVAEPGGTTSVDEGAEQHVLNVQQLSQRLQQEQQRQLDKDGHAGEEHSRADQQQGGARWQQHLPGTPQGVLQGAGGGGFALPLYPAGVPQTQLQLQLMMCSIQLAQQTQQNRQLHAQAMQYKRRMYRSEVSANEVKGLARQLEQEKAERRRAEQVRGTLTAL